MYKRARRAVKKKDVIMLAAGAVAAAALLISHQAKYPGWRGQEGSAVYSGARDEVLVERVVDGDTFKLASGERVRLIGIDTPEMHESEKLYRDSRRSGQDAKTIQALGRRSYAFTKKLIEGKTVRLEFDVEKRDKYNRLLAYAYLSDGTFVNAEIIRQGYASVMTYPPNVKHADEFLRLYRQARDNKLGLWKE